jgi:hypothetical protein
MPSPLAVCVSASAITQMTHKHMPALPAAFLLISFVTSKLLSDNLFLQKAPLPHWPSPGSIPAPPSPLLCSKQPMHGSTLCSMDGHQLWPELQPVILENVMCIIQLIMNPCEPQSSQDWTAVQFISTCLLNV